MNPAQQWVDAAIPDQSGRRIMITGATSGIGRRAAQLLAGRGAHVVLACRSVERGHEAVRQVRAAAPAVDDDLVHLDLGDLSAVAAALPDAQGADYWGSDGWFESRGLPTRVPASAVATDPDTPGRLWERSEELTRVRSDALRPAAP